PLTGRVFGDTASRGHVNLRTSMGVRSGNVPPLEGSRHFGQKIGRKVTRCGQRARPTISALLPAPALPPPGAASTSCPWPGTSRWPSPAHVGPAPTGQSRHRACPDPGGSGPRAHELSLHVLLSLCHNFLAQFLTLCRASNLAEALRISSP